MMWFDRQHPDVVFGDQRTEVLTVTDNSRGNASGLRTIRIEPDTTLDFRALPYPDETFRLVAFDPPHLVQAGPRSWLAAKYGKLSENWRDDLRQGFAECFRVLASDGVLVFKWNETQVKLSEVLALTPHAPLFGNTSGKKAGTHWLVFMKPNVEVRGATLAERPSRTTCWPAKERTMNDTIETWAQGYFVDQTQYRHWSAEAKADANCKEALNVRPSSTGNAICRTFDPAAAEWIAERLNMAAKLEALANKLHTAEVMKDQKEWVACLDAIYRTAHLPANA